MKFIRLRLTNYRGISNSELEFAREGLTIIQGPNEVGKTSHVEAIRLLFEYKDNSKCAEIKAVKPVDKDVGSEIELEAETGRYVFIYCKQFNKVNQTSLKIKHPKVENFTGLDAHQKMRDILEETMDVQLWKALCIQQGEPIRQADLSNQESLSKALDLAAAGHKSNIEDEDLLEKVRQEYELYFSDKGSLKKEFSKDDENLKAIGLSIEQLTREIHDLQIYSDRVAQAKEELESLVKQENNLQKDADRYNNSLNEITELERKLEFAKQTANQTNEKENRLKNDLTNRSTLIQKISLKKENEKTANLKIRSLKQELEEIEKNRKQIKLEMETVHENLTKIEEILITFQKDLDYLNKKDRIETLAHKKNNIDELRIKTNRINEFLKSCKIDRKALDDINNAEFSLLKAKAILDAGAPKLTLKGSCNQVLIINDRDQSISEGQEYHHSIMDKVSLTIPGALEMEIIPGNSASELLEGLHRAQNNLDTLCRKASASNVEDAKNAYSEMVSAQHEYHLHKENENKILQNHTYEELEKTYNRLRSEVDFYISIRQTNHMIPQTIEIAEKAKHDAENNYKKIKESFDAAKQKQKIGEQKLNDIKSKHYAEQEKQIYLAQEINDTERDLSRIRAEISDEKLQSEHENSVNDLKNAKLNLEKITNDLQKKQPEEVKFRLKTAQDSLKSKQQRSKTVLEDKANAEIYIKIHGEKGLREQLDAAKTRQEHEGRAYKSKIRRANATKLLYSILNEERNAARHAYIKPLKNTVEQLGRLVFNHSFEVEIDENLIISSRIMDNCNVPFESLSGGAKEQLSMLSRLACAMMTSKQGMSSIIIDDALGYTDANRLKLMGVALARASKECQIIILTCMPERYYNIGSAKNVELRCK